ncbi:MAG: endolytic transglycosylase MltG, partial [Sediminibacterium sp.]|nr:endolytic transglycosylase MltG [Sediminibacterium sp.]
MKGFKKLVLLLFLMLFVLALYTIFFPATRFSTSEKTFSLTPPLGKEQILHQLEEQEIVRFPLLLDLLYSFYGDWDLVQPGKYSIPKNASIWQIARLLKNSRKGVTKLVINKLRTKEDFAKLISHQFLIDSSEIMQFVTSNDSLREWGIDTSSFYTIIIPDTYEFYRNSSLQVILSKLRSGSEKFWLQNERLAKAEKLGLKTREVYTLASIVTEETNYASDQSLIASVYINRLHKKMPLQACPTIK